MTRDNQALSPELAAAVLDRCKTGILACLGEHGYPYAVPLNFVYYNQKIYFHSAHQGYKVDAMSDNPKVCFTVVDQDTVVSEAYTTYFRSVIAFGRTRIATGEERLSGFTALVDKYSGDQPEADRIRKVDNCSQALIIAVDIDHMTGKEAIELVNDH